MPYTSFHYHFQEVAEKETRMMTILREDDGIPKGSYGLLEMYCDDENCDCRRVFFDVFDWEHGKSLAYIAYGWESAEFYRKWIRRDDPETIRKLKGPALNFGSPQSQFAPAFLKFIRDVVLNDLLYIARLKRHYQMFKEKVDPKHFRSSGAAKRVEVAKSKSKSRKRH
jgi:hypothetical protein